MATGCRRKGESANGMRMPRRGFDSQNKCLPMPAWMPATYSAKADIASQVDATWAQQQTRLKAWLN